MDFDGFTSTVRFMFYTVVTWCSLGLCPWRASYIRLWPSVHWQSEAEIMPCFGLPVCARFQLPQCWPTEPPALCHTREETNWEGEYSHILWLSQSCRQLAQGNHYVHYLPNCIHALSVGLHSVEECWVSQSLKLFSIYSTNCQLQRLCCVLNLYLCTIHDHFTECCIQVGSIPASYSGGAKFESELMNYLFMCFFSITSGIWWYSTSN
jgi:hypothetical protein